MNPWGAVMGVSFIWTCIFWASFSKTIFFFEEGGKRQSLEHRGRLHHFHIGNCVSTWRKEWVNLKRSPWRLPGSKTLSDFIFFCFCFSAFFQTIFFFKANAVILEFNICKQAKTDHIDAEKSSSQREFNREAVSQRTGTFMKETLILIKPQWTAELDITWASLSP